MRKILALLVAVAAFASLAGVASADVSNPTYTNDHSASTDLGRTCTTPWSVGSFGAFGAQGFYVDGCTARIQCPTYARSCNAYATGNISDLYATYNNDTMNMRIRAMDSRLNVTSFQDTSCIGFRGCTTAKLSKYLSPGSYASVQCNGVRQTSAASWARDTCHIELFENFV